MNARVISGIMQNIFLIIGSFIFGMEFGWRIGLAVWFVGYALMPLISTRTSD